MVILGGWVFLMSEVSPVEEGSTHSVIVRVPLAEEGHSASKTGLLVSFSSFVFLVSGAGLRGESPARDWRLRRARARRSVFP